MRIGLVELLLILLIAALSIGPSVALWAERWMRRARKTTAAAARRRAAQEAQRAAEREEVLRRFQKLSIVFVLCAAAALVWGLVLRPIDTAPCVYSAPAEAAEAAGASSEVGRADQLPVSGYREISCIRKQEDWLYLAAQEDTRNGKAVLLRMREDGSGLAAILTAEGEITSFDFDPDGGIWYTAVTAEGGALCHVRSDGWGAAAEQVVTQIDGTPLHCPAAVAVSESGRVYFTDAAAVRTRYGVESALRTELIAHTGTGSVYLYDPAARTVTTVLSGLAGASGLALDSTSGTLYVSDLGSRCIWAVDPAAHELTAGGKGCTLFAAALPGYPGALALDGDGAVCVSYRWARSGWLERNAGSTLLRGAALRLSQTMQENLVSLPTGALCAEAFSPDGTTLRSVSAQAEGSCIALCPAGSRLYLAISGENEFHWVKI